MYHVYTWDARIHSYRCIGVDPTLDGAKEIAKDYPDTKITDPDGVRVLY